MKKETGGEFAKRGDGILFLGRMVPKYEVWGLAGTHDGGRAVAGHSDMGLCI